MYSHGRALQYRKPIPDLLASASRQSSAAHEVPELEVSAMAAGLTYAAKTSGRSERTSPGTKDKQQAKDNEPPAKGRAAEGGKARAKRCQSFTWLGTAKPPGSGFIRSMLLAVGGGIVVLFLYGLAMRARA
jgi:hypothetical protein